MRRLKTILIGAAAAALAVMAGMAASAKETKADPDTGDVRIYLEDVDVTLMDDGEIQAVIDEKMHEYATTPIDIDVYGQNVSIIAGELGLYRANSDLIDTVSSSSMPLTGITGKTGRRSPAFPWMPAMIPATPLFPSGVPSRTKTPST